MHHRSTSGLSEAGSYWVQKGWEELESNQTPEATVDDKSLVLKHDALDEHCWDRMTQQGAGQQLHRQT